MFFFLLSSKSTRAIGRVFHRGCVHLWGWFSGDGVVFFFGCIYINVKRVHVRYAAQVAEGDFFTAFNKETCANDYFFDTLTINHPPADHHHQPQPRLYPQKNGNNKNNRRNRRSIRSQINKRNDLGDFFPFFVCVCVILIFWRVVVEGWGLSVERWGLWRVVIGGEA